MPSKALRRTAVATVIDFLRIARRGFTHIKWVTLRTSDKGNAGILLESALQVGTSIAPEERAIEKTG
jgi:hypothetical protein